MDLRYVIILLLIIPSVYGSVRINEVMYNPEIGIYDFEYIEIHSETPINLSNFSIKDDGEKFDNLTLVSWKNSDYSLIVREGTNWNVNANLYYTKGVIGNNGLHNNGELISLWNDSELVDSIRYYGLVDKGKSLCKINNIWQECSATPGTENINLINYSIKINEFLPNPLGDDDALMPNGEWVELYNFGNEDLDLEGFGLQDNYGSEQDIFISDSNTLSGTVIGINDYLVVYMNGFFGLLNNEGFERISLYKENNLIDSVSYSGSEVGISFSKIGSKWVKSIPTPNEENEPILNIEQDYTKIKINELFPNPEGYDTTSMPNGEFVELYNSGDSALDLENLSLKDNYGQSMDIFISDSNTFSTIINPNDYLVVYMNGRFGFLNNDDFEKISLYKDDYLLDEVSYSGSSEGLTWSKVNDKWILSLPTPNSQNYNNESDITISRLKVDKIYDLGSDNIAKFGQIIRIKLLVYKGDTNKESIKFYIEDEDGDRISKESKVNVGDKFTNYTLTVPIQIIPNCNEKFSDGIYNIIVSGLDDRDEEEIEIEGITKSLCEVVTKYKESVISSFSGDGSENVLNDGITGYVVYEGEQEKQGIYAVYFFCFSLVMLIIYLLFKNE